MNLLKPLLTFEIVILAVVFFTAVGWMGIYDPDIYWHMKNGELILQNKSLFGADPFSHTAYGSRIQITGWFFDVLMAFTHTHFGEIGIRILSGIFISLTWVGVYKACRLYIDRKQICAILALLTFLLLGPVIAPRPNLFTNFAFAWTLYLLLSFTVTKRLTFLIYLIPLFAVWSNFHYGFAAALAIIVLFYIAAVGDVLFPWMEEKPLSCLFDTKPVMIFVVTAIAVGANPFGLQVYLEMYEMTVRGAQSFVSEWESPNFKNVSQKPLLGSILLYIFVIFMNWRRTSWLQIVIPTALIFGVLTGARHQAFWAIAFPIIMAMSLPYISSDGKIQLASTKYKKTSSNTNTPLTHNYKLNAVILICAIIIAIIKIDQQTSNQRKSDYQIIPFDAVDFMLENVPPGKLYNRYGSGGYLIWKGYPDYPVFVDGRYFPYSNTVLSEAIHILGARPGTQKLLEKYGVEIIIADTSSALSELLYLSNKFNIIYSNKLHSIFVLNNEKFNKLPVVERAAEATKVTVLGE